MNYVMTHSGKLVSPTGGTPTIEDIALGLSRTARFAGQGRRWWSVLDHSLFVHRMASDYCRDIGDTEQDAAYLGMIALLHDAHEALTGDVPTPFKPADLKELQQILDERIYEMAFKALGEIKLSAAGLIRSFDRRALLAESLLVGPPTLQTPEDARKHFGAAPLPADGQLWQEGIRKGWWGFTPVLGEYPEVNFGVRRFLNVYGDLEAIING